MNDTNRPENEEKDAEVTQDDAAEEAPKKPAVKGKRIVTGIRAGTPTQSFSSFPATSTWSCVCE